MTRMKIGVLAVLLALAPGCSDEDSGIESMHEGGGGTTGSSTPSGDMCNSLWEVEYQGGCLFILLPVFTGSDSSGATLYGEEAGSELQLNGTAFVSPTDSSCCPADAGVSVEWTNETTRETGAAASSVTVAGADSPRDWEHQFQARIPLRRGSNRISVFASDRSGNWAHRSITIRRVE